MNVLSLFDGISCGQVALDQLGVPVENYYASEVDKYAISITQKNYPNTIQLGDVTKWREWNIDWSKIDLVQGGSPCQGFSFAGKQLNFDDPRSALFFVFVDILNHAKKHNPNVKFLLENVRMKQEYQDVISERLGVKPVKINSALVSAQNRVRLYWTNIGEIEQPEDRGILLRDVLENGFEDLPITHISAGRISKKSNNGIQNIEKGTSDKSWFFEQQVYTPSSKTRALKAGGGSGNIPKCIQVGDKGTPLYWRKLTPLECERLQTLPDGYTEGVSNWQRYKALGNGWTVEVIKHIYQTLT